MANSRKRISELPALSVASLDTTFVLGISGSTTYKISINNLTSSLDGAFATDLVTATLSNALDGKVSTSSFNQYTASAINGTISGSSQLTSSFDQRYVVSGSIAQTTWDNIANKPAGIVSQSTDLSSLNTFTASISTASLVTSINNLNTFTSSYFTDSSSFDTKITTEKNRIDAILSASNANSDTFAEVVSLINSVDLTNDNAFATFYTASNGRLTSLENSTGSYLTSLSGAISSSSQVIGILSSLNSVSASLISKTGSYATTGSNTFYGDQIMLGNPSIQRVELSVGETYGGGKVFKILSGSYALIVDMNDLGAAQAQYMQIETNSTSTTGSVNQSLILARSGSTPNAEADINNPARGNYGLDMEDPAVMAFSSSVGGYTDWYIPSTTEIAFINSGVPGRIYEGFDVGQRYWTSNYAGSPYTYYVSDGQGRTSRILGNVSNGGSTQHPVVAIRKINQSYREVITTDNTNISITGSLSVSGSITGSTNFDTIVNKPTLISGSSQLTSSYDTRYVISGSVGATPLGTISGSAQITSLGFVSGSYLTSLSGAISSSSQLTSSFDTRYTLSGSVVSGTTPAGTISGSSQLTSSFDGRYTQTGSFNTLTASFNSFTASAQSVTTGSNSFNGTQTITGSLIITTGSFVASQILANTASLYLTSGSNMYVQNNGVVEITGSLIVSGSAAFNVNVLNVNGRSGDEGGEIQLAIPETNTTLQNRVTVDIWQNRLRIFEGSAGANGVYIDLSKPTGNNNEITYKASGIVNAGTFVQLDNIKATFTTSGNRGLSIVTVSGSFVAFITGTYTLYTGGVNGMGGNTTITTTSSTSLFGWSFFSQGDLATYIVNDTTNSRAYRITLMVGGGYNSNLITIERLH